MVQGHRLVQLHAAGQSDSASWTEILQVESEAQQQREQHVRSLRAAEDFGRLLENDTASRRRQLLQSCDDLTCLFLGVYTGDCGALGDREESRWCTEAGADFCCAESSADCCKISTGGIVLMAIGTPVVIALIVLVRLYKRIRIIVLCDNKDDTRPLQVPRMDCVYLT